MSTPQEQARDILAALRPSAHQEVPFPGEPPTSGAQAIADHAIKLEQYVDFLMQKPAMQLTAGEREFLAHEIREWSRQERR